MTEFQFQNAQRASERIRSRPKRERKKMCRETRQQTRNKQYNEAHLVASLNEQQQIEEDIRIYVVDIHMYVCVCATH